MREFQYARKLKWEQASPNARRGLLCEGDFAHPRSRATDERLVPRPEFNESLVQGTPLHQQSAASLLHQPREDRVQRHFAIPVKWVVVLGSASHHPSSSHLEQTPIIPCRQYPFSSRFTFFAGFPGSLSACPVSFLAVSIPSYAAFKEVFPSSESSPSAGYSGRVGVTVVPALGAATSDSPTPRAGETPALTFTRLCLRTSTEPPCPVAESPKAKACATTPSPRSFQIT